MDRSPLNSRQVVVFTTYVLLLCGAACGGTQTKASSPGSIGSEGAPVRAALPPPSSVSVSPSAKAVVDAPDREERDRSLDAQRRPAELLSFAGVRPGMRVAELMAGGGYTTELLARAVTPGGTVYSQNNNLLVQRYAERPWSERLAKPVLKEDVVRVDRELDDPLPPNAEHLDAVFCILFYHDIVWMGADRNKMNRAVYAALRPGGEYVIVDHSAKAGTGLSDVKTLHRIEEQTVADEVTMAGFRLVARANFLQNADDARNWNDSPMAAAERRGKSDRFVLKFVRP